MLIVLPLCLFGLSVLFDATGRTSPAPVWGTIAYGNLAGGTLVALLTAGIEIAESRIRPCRSRLYRALFIHHFLSFAAIALFAASLALRTHDPSQAPDSTAVWFSVLGLFLLALAAWAAPPRV